MNVWNHLLIIYSLHASTPPKNFAQSPHYTPKIPRLLVRNWLHLIPQSRTGNLPTPGLLHCVECALHNNTMARCRGMFTASLPNLNPLILPFVMQIKRRGEQDTRENLHDGTMFHADVCSCQFLTQNLDYTVNLDGFEKHTELRR